MNELALFAGAGGGILGGKLLGWRTVCAVEVEPYARDVLLARQRDGIFDLFPVWDDVRTFDGEPWRGYVDVVSGGFPCQDISVAGSGAGLNGDRSGLWREMARIIGEARPQYVFVENSPMLVVRGLDRVLADLAALGFDVAWRVLSAADLGAPHLRERIWIVGRNVDNAIGKRRAARRNDYREHDRNVVGAADQHAGALADADSQRSGETREFRSSTELRSCGGCEDVRERDRAQRLVGSKNHNRALTNDRLDYTIEREASESGSPGRLNPEFVEWLMGWPIGHTGLEPVAMDRWHEWQQRHSPSCATCF